MLHGWFSNFEAQHGHRAAEPGQVCKDLGHRMRMFAQQKHASQQSNATQLQWQLWGRKPPLRNKGRRAAVRLCLFMPWRCGRSYHSRVNWRAPADVSTAATADRLNQRPAPHKSQVLQRNKCLADVQARCNAACPSPAQRSAIGPH